MVKQQNIVNVASVPQRSPFRYAGGKTWLIPRIREWLGVRGGPSKELIEPFAGGGIVALTAVMENLVKKATMVELDEDVAAVWQAIMGDDGEWLADRISHFHLTPENVRKVLSREPTNLREQAFATILKNRVYHGGILAPGAGLIKQGENGKGLASRWYPETLRKRILAIAQVRDRIEVIQGDGISIIEKNMSRQDVVFFIDPPYAKAGRRLYRYSEMNHEKLFDLAAHLSGDFLITYDDAEQVRTLVKRYGLESKTIAMKNTHHAEKKERLIGRDLSWLKTAPKQDYHRPLLGLTFPSSVGNLPHTVRV
jgi:DNA adenine methylase